MNISSRVVGCTCGIGNGPGEHADSCRGISAAVGRVSTSQRVVSGAQPVNHDQQNDLELIRRALFSGQKSIAKSQAQAAFLRLVEQLPSAPRGLGEISQQDINEIQDLLENIPTNLEEDRRNSRVIEALGRARVVGVLDAWASAPERGPLAHPVPSPHPEWGQGWYVPWGGKRYYGATPDAARAAAAKAIETKRLP